eukprot:COSAG04_NODE_20217_length_398_cov_0.692308_1_plen_41_part_10
MVSQTGRKILRATSAAVEQPRWLPSPPVRNAVRVMDSFDLY